MRQKYHARGAKKTFYHKSLRPDLSHIETPEGSKAVPLGIKGDYALVDEEDYDKVMEHNWNKSYYGYAVSNSAGLMHRFILGVKDPKRHVHHIDHNPLNNRRCNIVECSHRENLSHQNPQKRDKSSKFKGVSWAKNVGKWNAYIKHKSKRYNIGWFDSEIEAAKAYDEAAKKYHGEFARLNLPNE